MTQRLHGHEVIEMMIASGKTYTKASLQAAIIERFGTEARFYTCSAENMTAAELIEFLAARDKFTPRAGGFTMNAAKVCNHEGHEHHDH
jgi:probable metal-binding protein